MSFEENYQVTSNFSELTHDFLSSHLIAPTPVNYAVVYLYISDENKLLTKAIDKKLQQGLLITADFMADLFKQFVSFSKQIENNVLSPFEKVLTKTLEQISKQVSRVLSFRHDTSLNTSSLSGSCLSVMNFAKFVF